MPVGAIPFPFGDCRICNDKATGVHYGVATCEGCKGFFRRSIPKGEKYKCFFGGQCIISPQNRNRCKACRFKKCLDRGMAIDAVKMGRIPKIEKEKALEAARQTPTETNMEVTQQQPTYEDKEMNFQNHNLQVPGPSLNIKQEAGTSSYSCDKLLYNNSTYSHNSDVDTFNNLHTSNNIQSWDNFTSAPPMSGDPTLAQDSQYVAGSSSTMYENHCFSNIPRNTCTPGSDDSNCSPSSRSHYSPDVIKVLFDQAVEHRGGKNIKERILQYFADNCSSNQFSDSNSSQNAIHDSDMHERMLRDAVVEGDKKSWAECRNFEKESIGREGVLEGQILNSMDLSDNTIPQFSQPSIHHLQTTQSAYSTSQFTSSNNGGLPFQNSSHCEELDLSMLTGTQPTNFSGNTAYGSGNTLTPEQNFAHSGILKTGCNMLPTNQSLVTSHEPSCTDLDFSDPHQNEDTVFSVLDECYNNSYQDSSLDQEYYMNIVGGKVYTIEDVYFMIERSNEKKREMGQWMEKTVREIEKNIDTFNQYLRENRVFAHQFIKDKKTIPKQVKTDELLQDTWQMVISGISIVNKRIIGFCNAVPGFASVCKDDQQPMLKYAYYSIWMLTTSEFFINGQSYLRFPNGTIYTRFLMDNLIGKDRTNHIFAFAKKFNQLNLTETEIGILAAIHLMTYDNPEFELHDAQSVQILNSHYVDIFVQLVSKSHLNSLSEVLLAVFNLFPQLRHINKMQRDMVTELMVVKQPPPEQSAVTEKEQKS